MKNQLLGLFWHVHWVLNQHSSHHDLSQVFKIWNKIGRFFFWTKKKLVIFFLTFQFWNLFNFLIIFTIDYAPDIIESRNKEARIIDFEIFKSFLFASAQIATKKCNCTHTLKLYLTMREGGLGKLDHGTILNLQFFIFY